MTMSLDDELAFVYNQLVNGNTDVLNFDLFDRMSKAANAYINNPVWSKQDVITVLHMLNISDILYNNSSINILPLDDGLYDQLLILFKQYEDDKVFYTPGAASVKFKEVVENEIDQGPKKMCTCIPDEDIDRYLYTTDIMKQNAPCDPRLTTMCTLVREPISKRLVISPHNYPELVGTLDKCKFVLMNEAIEKNVADKPSITVFERDFILKHLDMGIIQPDEEFSMIAELKYDGVSVEAAVCGDRIITACSRGDTGENLATDLTPIFSSYRFMNAKDVPKDIAFGIKFEAIITKHDLQRLSQLRNKSYKNCRNAIIGLLSSSDGYRYTNFITLIPLSTSLDMEREDEIKFLNKYYSSGQYNRYSIITGNYISVLFQVNQFTKSAELLRPVMPYLYDGVVVSYTDKDKINKLGRVNSVNKYSMAIKFNPKEVRTLFLGYTFTVGKSGNITPMAHFKECEFIGTIHTEQTVHSYRRFKELGLRKYDEIDVEYRNDVICYITKPHTEHNANNNNPIITFPTVCPVCGSTLEPTASGDNIICPNQQCEGRNTRRMIDMLDKLNFKGFSEATVKALPIHSLYDLLTLYPEDTIYIGPTNQAKLHAYIESILNNPVKDYVLLSALGFENIGDETWKLILHEHTLQELYEFYNSNILNETLVLIHGIGDTTALVITNGFKRYIKDIEFILRHLQIIDLKTQKDKPKIAITGFRDQEFIDLLNEHGFDASDSYGVSKKISYLIAADPNTTSSKIDKAKKLGIPILSRQEFITINNLL